MRRHLKIATAFLCVAAVAMAQSAPTTTAKALTPESGLISAEKYTNEFFGFSMPIPKSLPLGDLLLPSKGTTYQLFGLKVERESKGLTAFTVSASESSSASSDEVRKAASGTKRLNTTRLEIGGKEFWKSEALEKSRAGKIHTVTYATALKGYVLEFSIYSFDSEVTEQLQRCMEGITFFDPQKAREMAGPDSRPYVTAAAASEISAAKLKLHIDQLDPGAVSGNVYTNEALGFSYEIPQGWVIADKETQQKVIETGHQAAWGEDPAAAKEHEVMSQCSRVLLWITKYPEGTTEEVNPLINVTAYDPKCLGGFRFPSSADNKDVIMESARQLLHAFEGAPFTKGQNSVRAFTGQGRLFLDMSGSWTMKPPNKKRPVTSFSSIVFSEANGFVLAWFFADGSQSGLNEIKKTNVQFFEPHDPPKPKP